MIYCLTPLHSHTHEYTLSDTHTISCVLFHVQLTGGLVCNYQGITTPTAPLLPPLSAWQADARRIRLAVKIVLPSSACAEPLRMNYGWWRTGSKVALVSLFCFPSLILPPRLSASHLCLSSPPPRRRRRLPFPRLLSHPISSRSETPLFMLTAQRRTRRTKVRVCRTPKLATWNIFANPREWVGARVLMLFLVGTRGSNRPLFLNKSPIN